MLADRARERTQSAAANPGETSCETSDPGETSNPNDHPSESTNSSETSASRNSGESAHHATIEPIASNDGTPLVSIIVPVYNARASLHDCISSITAQTYAHLEIILIDDGSDDGSSMYCDLWTRLDSRIRVIHQRNAGVSAARNRGIDEACGDYLMFVDADDTLLADAVETVMTMIALAQRSSASVATDADQRPVIPDMVSFDFSVFRNRTHLDRTNVLPHPYPDHVLVSSGADCLRYVYQGRIGTYVWSFLYSTRFLHR
ncbi:glycosyltransferase family 2 protein [Bifidobacterium jacchi]|nr:glycosyltransferase [Bifidobacterium jacchi]